jgi:hypothetical protein
LLYVEQSEITYVWVDCILLMTFSSSDAALSFRGSIPLAARANTPRADYNSPIRGQWGTKFMPVHNKHGRERERESGCEGLVCLFVTVYTRALCTRIYATHVKGCRTTHSCTTVLTIQPTISPHTALYVCMTARVCVHGSINYLECPYSTNTTLST